MRVSIGCLEGCSEGCPVADDGPEGVHAPSGEGDDGLVVSFALVALALRFARSAAPWRTPKARLPPWPSEQKADR